MAILCKRPIDPLQYRWIGEFICERDLHLALSRIDPHPFDFRIIGEDALDRFGVRFVLHTGVRSVRERLKNLRRTRPNIHPGLVLSHPNLARSRNPLSPKDP